MADSASFPWDDDGDPLSPPVQASAGIGLSEATCVPVTQAEITAGTAIACSYLVRDAAGPVGSIFSGTASFTFAEPPQLGLLSITGQLEGAQAARGGDSLVVAGTGWDPASGLSAELCAADDETSCDPSSSTAGLSVDAGGNLLGSVEVFPLNSAGLRVLKITQTSNGQRALVPIRILGVRSIVIDPASGNAGAPIPINITGTDFDPLQPVTVTGSDGVNPTTDVGAGAVDSDGVLTGSIIVTSPATAAIVVTEDDAPTTDGAAATFAISSQIITGEVTITGGALTVTQPGNLVEMSPILLSGQAQESSGVIQSVTVADMRGSLSGWTVTATATDWVDVTVPDPSNPIPGHFFPAGNLSWSPSCTPAPGSTADPADVTPGPVDAQLDPVTAATLCSAAPGGGGGGWVTGASLSLQVPASIAAGNYRATLTIVAV